MQKNVEEDYNISMENLKVNPEEIEKIKEEAIKLYKNAKETLNKSPLDDEGEYYEEIKYVQEAYGALWLSILKALDYALLKTGKVTKKELPQSSEAYRDYINKYLLHKDGKLRRRFESLYNAIHIAGYYRGLRDTKKGVKVDFEDAKEFLQKLGIEVED
ncbi:MAG: DUF5618 family protein [candidate division WOR-3 bacterium]